MLDTLLYLHRETDVWFEITTLLIPDENDSTAELEELTRWVYDNLGPDIPIHFSAFHPDFKMLDKPKTPPETVQRAREIALKNGLNYAYVGNIYDEAGDSTYCPGCKKKVLSRNWYKLGDCALTNTGECMYCGYQLSGRFAPPPKAFGRQRIPIRIA